MLIIFPHLEIQYVSFLNNTLHSDAHASKATRDTAQTAQTQQQSMFK